jgi:3-methyladenine DNA glycosylase AlkC
MAKLLKHLYDKDYIATLADDISKEYQNFKKGKFIDTIFDTNWKNKELKQRMRHISSTMGIFLPKDYEKSINILKKVFTKKQTYKKRDENQGIQNMIFQDFVEVYGLDYFDISMEALECFTQNCTSEFAIREFILKYEDKTMDIMTLWAKSKSIHTRRLATEGCRPRLPWATFLPKFQKDPTKIIKILEILKNDDEKYVQKSIANNLNDISKDNPQIVISLAKQWLGKSKSLDYIVKHGCRTLLKTRDKETLYLFGYKNIKDLQIVDIKVDKKVTIGDKLF